MKDYVLDAENVSRVIIVGTRCNPLRQNSLAGKSDTFQVDANYFYMSLLDLLGKPFIYQSPPPISEEKRYEWHLYSLSNRILRKIAGTTSHYSKANLVKMILENRQTP